MIEQNSLLGHPLHLLVSPYGDMERKKQRQGMVLSRGIFDFLLYVVIFQAVGGDQDSDRVPVEE